MSALTLPLLYKSSSLSLFMNMIKISCFSLELILDAAFEEIQNRKRVFKKRE